MIIKVKDKNTWWMYDNVSKIRFGDGSTERVLFFPSNKEIQFVLRDGKAEKPFQPDIMIIDEFDENELADDRLPLGWISFRNKNDDEKFMVFNTVAFILNDNGKTIEIIR